MKPRIWLSCDADFAHYDEHVGDWGVGYPHLRAVKAITVRHFLCAGLHASRIGSGVRFGKAEATDPLAGRKLGQEFLALSLVAVSVDRIHHKGRLHAVHRAVAGIDAFDFARYQTVGNVAGVGATILFGEGHPDQA
jgi:hypothetical protein